MTRKDYIRLARALGLSLRLTYQDYANNADRELAASAVVKAADRVSAELEQDNPRFDREHFLAVVRGERAADSRPPRRKAEGTE